MHTAMLLSFQDELEKISFDVMHAAAKEGIEMAKKLKAKNLVPKAGNALKDYMGHMDLSAHPKFSGGVKATAQGAMKKVSSMGTHAAELAGLGILAVPSIQHLRGKEMSEGAKAKTEIGGLGVLAAPSAVAAGKAGLGKLKAVARASKVSKLRNAAVGFAKHAVSKEWISKKVLNSKTSPERLKKFMNTSKDKGTALFNKAVKSGDSDYKKIMKHKGKRDRAVLDSGKKLMKEAAPSMSAMMNMHRLADSAKAAKNVAKPAAAAAVKLPNQAAQAARASSLANHTAVGGHAWNPAAQAKRAIPL